MIVLDPKDRQSFAFYALRVVAVVIVAIVCGAQSAGLIGSMI